MKLCLRAKIRIVSAFRYFVCAESGWKRVNREESVVDFASQSALRNKKEKSQEVRFNEMENFDFSLN